MSLKIWGQYLAGAWTTTPVTRDILSPFDGGCVGHVSVGTVADAEAAITVAYASFDQTRKLAAHERHSILRAIEAGLTSRRNELVSGIVAEAGKTLRDARAEVDRAILVFSLAAEEARRLNGETIPLDLNAASAGRLGLTRRFPAGVVGAITPFNFPLNLVAHKVAPALAVGCPVVLKPSERTPLTSLRLAEIIDSTAWPKGAFSVLTPEKPQEIGTLFATDPRIAVLSFTGSDVVGWNLKTQAVKKRVTLELGGNAAVIVHEDADLDYAVSRCVVGSFANAGQVCISVQRLYVHRPVYETFTEKLLTETRKLKVGDPSDAETDIGPMITPQARDAALSRFTDAEAKGGLVILRGEATGRAFLSPTIFADVPATAELCQTEAFAPVVLIEAYDDFADALTRVNDSRYGLQAGVFTKDVSRLFVAFSALEVGGVIANDVPQYRVDHMPYGGEKDSGFGREGVRYAMDEMTTLRLMVLNLG